MKSNNSIKGKIVYMKFDNSKYLNFSENGRKYISGCFIPYSDLIKPELKK
jgi:hypothetical protein